MSVSDFQSIADVLHPAYAFAYTSVTAGGSGDAGEITGEVIDLADYKYPTSCAILIQVLTTVSASETLTIGTFKLEQANVAAMTSATNFATPSDIVLSGALTANKSVQKVHINLIGCKRYIRLKVTPDMSKGSGDTATLTGIIVFGASGQHY